MCTAISKHGEKHLFGRTLDLEFSYGESAVIAPRKFNFVFLYEEQLDSHYAVMGTAYVRGGVPLFYDAVNECGLAIAGLNFPGNAVYRERIEGMHNVAPFEFIPWILSRCDGIFAAKELLKNVNIVQSDFSTDLPATPLHWIIADKGGCITAEPTKSGLQIYENPFGVLTNNPEFSYHITNLSNYMQMGAEPPKNTLCPGEELNFYSRGLGAMGLPGDYSSQSRFVRAVFAKNHTVCEKEDEVTEFFHIINTVSQPRGCVLTDKGEAVYTVYTSCADTDSGTYYFTTYGDRRIRAIKFDTDKLDSHELIKYSMDNKEDILYLN